MLLIRHGQTPHNVTGALDTAFPGAGLTALGEAQARALPTALSGETISAIYASPLLRTQLTATPLAEELGLGITVVPGLEEISAGDLELRSDEDSRRTYAGTVAAWLHGDLSPRMPGGSDGHEFLERYDGAIRSVVDRHGADDTVVVVSHGAAIRSYVGLRTTVGEEASLHLGIHNTGAAFLDGDPDDWKLTVWHSDPLGGHDLDGFTERDITGESADEALEED